MGDGRSAADVCPGCLLDTLNDLIGAWTLQIQFNLQAFLARPSEQGAFSPDDCTTVLSPLSMDAFVEHGLEPSSDIEFRFDLLILMCSSLVTSSNPFKLADQLFHVCLKATDGRCSLHHASWHHASQFATIPDAASIHMHAMMEWTVQLDIAF